MEINAVSRLCEQQGPLPVRQKYFNNKTHNDSLVDLTGFKRICHNYDAKPNRCLPLPLYIAFPLVRSGAITPF